MLSEPQKQLALKAYEGAKPKRHKGKYINDFYTCGNCGSGVAVEHNFCSGCGFRVLWDNPRCLTDYGE